MKLLFASDIHGSGLWCERLISAAERENPAKICLLGDLLYHGPRNDLPEGFAPKEVISLLNSVKDRLLCVRGNCDCEVDQMVLEFPVLAPTALLYADNFEFFLYHGHLEEKFGGCDFVISGHTHIPKREQRGKTLFLNCGSAALPKENSPHSYLVYENGEFSWKDLSSGAEFDSFCVGRG